MMMDYYEYTNELELMTTKFLPYIRQTMDFFYNHYQHINGKLFVYPSQALETWWCPWPFPTNEYNGDCVMNDSPTLAG
eukprot:UN05206